MALKKAASKKTAAKKAAAKKTVQKKATGKKKLPVKTKSKKVIPKGIISQVPIEEPPTSGDCMCKQKRPNGKFFCFRLVQGRWVQSSGTPFPTLELCQEANC